MKKTLYMYFKTSGDRTVSMAIDNARDDLTALEVKSAMNDIVMADVIETDSGKIMSAHSAKIVEQSVTALEIA